MPDYFDEDVLQTRLDFFERQNLRASLYDLLDHRPDDVFLF